MGEISAGEPRREPPPEVSEVRIGVENLGPIGKGAVHLRPLTVFVGPGNTGKTYLAILIYALQRIFRGFPRFPFLSDYMHIAGNELPIPDDEYETILEKIRADEKPFYFSDMPDTVRDAMLSALCNPGFSAKSLGNELERCFDVAEFSALIRDSSESGCTNISLRIGETGHANWSFRMTFSDSDLGSDGSIDDTVLIRDRLSRLDPDYSMRFDHFRTFLKANASRGMDWKSVVEFFEFSASASYFMPESTSNVHYFPADRSGVMHSHRVIASSLIARSTRGGLERFPELPMIPGVMADFIQQLIMHDEPGRWYRRRPAPRKRMGDIADFLERETLGGQIRTVRGKAGGYPELVYCPEGAKGEIRLSRASSMVSELAPLVLFMRSAIGRGDTVIIEEPEAHLHPAAQTAMAKALARLVRAGVRVAITTHSDWLLKEIGNLIREGELSERIGESEDESADALRPRDVGVWLFDRQAGDGGATVREIPFDRIDGIEPADYESVAERLYNRSADLQNRFEEEVARRRAPG